MNLRYLVFDENQTRYPVCFLTKTLSRKEQYETYVQPYGLDSQAVIYQLHLTGKNTPVKAQKEFLDLLLPELAALQTDYIVVTDSGYFKTLTKMKKADSSYGYVLPCAIPGYEHINVVIVPSSQLLFYQPQLTGKIAQGMEALVAHQAGKYQPPGIDIIHFAEYPESPTEIQAWLDKLIDTPLTMDIEAFSLKHWDAGIGTITLCWSQHEGIAFTVDFERDPVEAQIIRGMLKDWFTRRLARTIWHRVAYDGYVLIYQLFMKDLLDTEGMLTGLRIMLRNFDDTLLITYLATNNCGGNELGLKAQSQEFTGNYAVEEINDIRQIPKKDLLQYNLIDGLATWYVHNKHWGTMVEDDQLDIYQSLFKPAMFDIIQMQLTGLPVDMQEVAAGRKVLEKDWQSALDRMMATAPIKRFIVDANLKWVDWKNGTLKKKQVTLLDANETFNPNSGPQLQTLLYEQLGLPVLDYTDSKLPATGGKTLKKLVNHTEDPEILALLEALIDFKAVDKILVAFIPAFEAAPQGPDGWHYLFGNFNLGGTVSGRLSSNGPNLQNLPATGSKYAKVIKKMFKAPPGWLFIGLDYASLEDRISALTTKDPNKLKVYTDGYDGHCLRAHAYFGEHMPDIDASSVESINSIDGKYKDWRQKSKAPTFALTYQGTYATLMNNCGFSKELAMQVEARYHELYVVSTEWVKAKLDQACRDGYVTAAFGLRVRTPMLGQTVLGVKCTPREAAAEGRTAGNALGQSWGLLNTRAVMAFMKKVRTSEHRLTIRPCAQIHDANYYIVKDDIDVVEWLNTHLVEEVKWQDHPDIWHDEVKLGGEVSVFYPHWANDITIPNGASQDEIKAACQLGLDKYLHPEKYEKKK